VSGGDGGLGGWDDEHVCRADETDRVVTAVRGAAAARHLRCSRLHGDRVTSSSDVGAFVGLGGDQTSSVTTSVDTDPTNPFEVDLTQGSDEGVKLGLSLKDPPLGGALVDELWGTPQPRRSTSRTRATRVR